MKYYIIAGEASGDLHGSNLIKEIRKLDPDASVRCWGGDLMQAAGATLVKHYRDLAFMGFVEVVRHLGTILRNMSFCKKDILAFNPDLVIFIDYPGFNIPIAEFAKDKGFKTVYYISPQVWAWKEGRVKTLRKVIDKMLVILPFEKDFYRTWNYEVEYVGHPLVEVVEPFRKSDIASTILDLPLIALLPGSRKQEIAAKLPVMLEVTRHFPGYRFAVAQAPSIDDAFIQSFTRNYPQVEIRKGATYPLLRESSAALVTSGTATLETALIGVPEVVCYKGSPISYAIAKKVIRVKYISLVNLIMDREVVKELIQQDLTVDNLRKELTKILDDPDTQGRLQDDYRSLWELLSAGGHASSKAASSIIHMLKG
ncbi:MAG: lipid-A-disaccharide synthase [Chitinophagaceae bacterium]|nr:lipid-A-disaccharide synthase [Chitinophagaceae bacterium]